MSHSRQYRYPDEFTNKTVLVVDAAVRFKRALGFTLKPFQSSGSEIARDITPYARKVYVSIRVCIYLPMVDSNLTEAVS